MRPTGYREVMFPVVVFAARDREERRHWRAVAADGVILTEDLDILRLADPNICDEFNAQLDPAANAQRLPASQRWALDVLRDPSCQRAHDMLMLTQHCWCPATKP